MYYTCIIAPKKLHILWEQTKLGCLIVIFLKNNFFGKKKMVIYIVQLPPNLILQPAALTLRNNCIY